MDISFPRDYEPNTIKHQAKLVDQAIKDFKYLKGRELERKLKVALNPREKTYGELA